MCEWCDFLIDMHECAQAWAPHDCAVLAALALDTLSGRPGAASRLRLRLCGLHTTGLPDEAVRLLLGTLSSLHHCASGHRPPAPTSFPPRT